MMFVVAPAIGTPLLAQVSHLPPSDWKVGVTFFVSAALQAVALVVARRHFAFRRVARPA
jgi:DHA1 family tetracycline resistance protein-like MFS transporter